MEFYTASSRSRPVRLSEATRRFAYDSLHFRYGRETKETPCVMLSDRSLAGASLIDGYDAAVRAIAEECPIRICEGERISGSATLGLAISGTVPALIDGVSRYDWSLPGTDHLTVDLFEILKVGYRGIRKRAENAAENNADPSHARFYESVFVCLDAFETYHKRYIRALSEMGDGYLLNLETLRRVPAEGAENFLEAVQSIWFTFSFLRLCGNWPGIGRLDVLLGDYLRHDLDVGILTLFDAREILAHFFIKGCEWICGDVVYGGDAQHYQNIVLSGIDLSGRDVTNEVTYLVLDIVEELGIGDFPITVRVNSKTDEKLLRRIAEVISYGGGIVAVYNEDLILRSLANYGYPYDEAVRFANDGCWEVQVPGATNFSYIPFDGLQVLQKKALSSYERTDFSSFEEVYSAFKDALKGEVEGYRRGMRQSLLSPDGRSFKTATPATVVSIFEKDCIGRGLSYHEGGTDYRIISLHIGGLADITNSLYAIKKLVFDDEKVTLEELFRCLKSNWEGREELRRYALCHYRYFGNGNAECDGIYRRIIDDLYSVCLEDDKDSPIKFPPGVSTFGRQVPWKDERLATPFGKFEKDVLSGNSSPTPGTDLSGVTSVIRSYCSADLTKTVTGAALDISLSPKLEKDDTVVDATVSLIRGFLLLGGYFMQLDITNAEILREAQRHPENYRTLSVRVSGWNARFATLEKSWQDMIIERAEGKR